MVSPLPTRTLQTEWRFALIGALASLPVAAVVNSLPNSEATLGGGVMIIGAFIGGAIAAIRSASPDAAGLRAGFLGGVIAVLTFIVTVVSAASSGTVAAWTLSRIVFWVAGGVLVLCVAPIFGLGCGRVGGWAANTVSSRWATGANASK
ncbi:hypothetical protein C499_14085 [Halogeometricum borinquense DSM 11551]|uniref:DUF5518 domain-containing protein n=2 Tax=Halogeometricum borinquense TaxID=60847 RepID=E4NTZ1_HALBP|nr:DUF5518 domain-containing protein [Halogeometricum borinquense]ADQ68511.1 hypothetical protein Hbor_29720 [Halogeometricum borinquense DSM 11551]ELY25618.1 hypothetical protein C499_14085 [Halogeometricum borinquense DSM 11551]RYJ08509.1 hypothetical protein ELS19_18500 [Halogeometricum borinquense]